MLRLSRFPLVIAFVLAGCTKTTTKIEYVARVGDAVLTKEELAQSGTDTAEQLQRQFVSQWVTAQLLYQEAARGGFAESEEVRRRVEETRRQFAVNAFLEREVYDDVAEISDGDALDEFTRNRGAYRLREDVVNMSYALFDDRDAANSFRSKILRGATWDEAIQSTRTDAELKTQLLRFGSNGYFTQAMLYPEELWKMARTLSKEDVSYVVRTQVGQVVALVHGMKRQGEIPEFDYAKSEIKERLLIERRRKKYDELLAKLRGKYAVEVRLNSMDSTSAGSEK